MPFSSYSFVQTKGFIILPAEDVVEFSILSLPQAIWRYLYLLEQVQHEKLNLLINNSVYLYNMQTQGTSFATDRLYKVSTLKHIWSPSPLGDSMPNH